MTKRQQKREIFVQRTARNLPPVVQNRQELRMNVYYAACAGEAEPYVDRCDDWQDSALPEWRAAFDAADFADASTLGDWPGYSVGSLQLLMQDILDAWIECNGEPKEK